MKLAPLILLLAFSLPALAARFFRGFLALARAAAVLAADLALPPLAPMDAR